jgi:hypothetical protein
MTTLQHLRAGHRVSWPVDFESMTGADIAESGASVRITSFGVAVNDLAGRLLGHVSPETAELAIRSDWPIRLTLADQLSSVRLDGAI